MITHFFTRLIFIFALALPTNVSAQPSDSDIKAWILECDTLSAHPSDHLSNVAGVSWGDLNFEKASVPCSALLKARKFTGKLLYQSARMMDKVGNPDAVKFLKAAIDEFQYPMAYYHLGTLYEEGLYVDESYYDAMKYYKEAFDRGSLHSGIIWSQKLGEDISINPFAFSGYWKSLQMLSTRGHTPADERMAELRANGRIASHNELVDMQNELVQKGEALTSLGDRID